MEGRIGGNGLPILNYDLIKRYQGDKYGFTVTDKRHKRTGLFRTEQIINGTIASKVHLRRGFCVVEVNGQNVSDMSRNEIMQMLATSGNELCLLMCHPEVFRYYRKRRQNVGRHLPSVINISNRGENQHRGLYPRLDQDEGMDYGDLNDLQNAYHGGLVTAGLPFECQICLQQIQPGQGVVLKECLHQFCRDCLRIVVTTTEDPVVICPYVGDYECQQELLQHEIKELVPQDAFGSFIGKNLKAAQATEQKSFQCNTLNCMGWCIYNEGEMDVFKCPECHQINCLRCQAIHKEMSCQQYQALKESGRIRAPIGPGGERVEYDPHAMEELEHVYDGGLVHPKEEFECPICFDKTQPQNGVILKNCLHQFCRECLAEHVGHSEDASIKCPYAGDYTCDVEIAQHEMSELVQREVYDKYMDNTVRVAEGTMTDAFHCKTPDCKGFWIIEAGINNHECPVCQENNCMNCKAVHGHNVNCQEFQIASDTTKTNKLSEDAVEQKIAEGRAQRCPNCQFVIEKHGGCRNMTCSRCGRGFRWTGIDC